MIVVPGEIGKNRNRNVSNGEEDIVHNQGSEELIILSRTSLKERRT